MAKKLKPTVNKLKPLRTHQHVFMLNDDENRALNRYIIKYKVKNKSRFIRETLMISILRKFDEDHPTLFD
jgi:hypothetical protein